MKSDAVNSSFLDYSLINGLVFDIIEQLDYTKNQNQIALMNYELNNLIIAEPEEIKAEEEPESLILIDSEGQDVHN